MRKAEKIELEKTLYSLSLTQCPEHKLPLVHHFDDWGEGCWDCPVDGCGHHIHEAQGKPWSQAEANDI